jgi:hypothetical protein
MAVAGDRLAARADRAGSEVGAVDDDLARRARADVDLVGAEGVVRGDRVHREVRLGVHGDGEEDREHHPTGDERAEQPPVAEHAQPVRDGQAFAVLSLAGPGGRALGRLLSR